MRKITTIDFTKNDEKSYFETPLTLRQYVLIHFGAWGFYGITYYQKDKSYAIWDKFTGEVLYEIR
jgi:hypothetical protein